MDKARYIRQTTLEKIGQEGQDRLLAAHVIVVGCGGLGSIAAPYLAGAGIGKITLIDGDRPDISNLHRQVFYTSESTSETKSEILAKHISELNPGIVVKYLNVMLTKENIKESITDANLVLECTDNIQCKYLVNDFCHLQNIPMVYGAIYKYDGYVSTFLNKTADDIHLRDIFGEPNEDIPSCSEVGVLGTLAGLIGLLQANEAIKYISRCSPTLTSQLLTYNILSNDQFKLKLKKTYKGNLKSIFNHSTYSQDLNCTIPTIEFAEVKNNPNEYRLVSILDDTEHTPLTNNVERELLSDIEPTKWSPTDKRTTVFYCVSGKRSASLVMSILTAQPDKKVISLSGGTKKAISDL